MKSSACPCRLVGQTCQQVAREAAGHQELILMPAGDRAAIIIPALVWDGVNGNC